MPEQALPKAGGLRRREFTFVAVASFVLTYVFFCEYLRPLKRAYL